MDCAWTTTLGASPMLVRQLSEAVGRRTQASKVFERIQSRFMHGDTERLPEHMWWVGESA